MAKALITDCGVATIGAGPVFTAAAAGTGSTFTTRNADLNTNIWLLDAWFKGPHAGAVRLTSPNVVPVANGIRINCPTGLADFLLPRTENQKLVPQDQLTIQLNGTAADVNGIAIQTYYEQPGFAGQKLASPGDVDGSYDYIFGWPVAAAAAAAAGNQQSTVITTTVDSSDANRWYAVLGYQVDTTVLAVGIAGADTSQFFVGGPGDTAGFRTGGYFRDLYADIGLPCIPCFNAANKANTNVVVVDNAAGTAVNVTLILAQMQTNWTPPVN